MDSAGKLFPKDSEDFRRRAKALAEELIEMKASGRAPLMRAPDRPSKLPLPPITPEGLGWEQGVRCLLDQVYSQYIPPDHHRYFAFVPGPASPLSWLGGMISDAFNAHSSGWMSSRGPASVEDDVIRYCAGRLGYGPGSGGLMVSGGSHSNLTAVCLARDERLGEEERHLGVAYLSDQTHSSVARSLKVIGLTDGRIRKIPTDEGFRMDLGLLEEAVQADRIRGLKPFLVVATAGTTNTGTVDPMKGIAAICEAHGLWMHVDGAYGASVALSSSHQHLLDGIERADSVSWDAHKWLFQTYGSGMLLVKEGSRLYRRFHTHPEYLRDLETEPELPNHMDMGIELTRPARAVRLWFTLSVAGSDEVGKAIDHGVRMAEYACARLREQEPVRIVSEASMGILNFRFEYPGMSAELIDRLNRRICLQTQRDGNCYVASTELRGKVAIRLCTIHPCTSERDLDTTIRELLQKAGRECDAMGVVA